MSVDELKAAQVHKDGTLAAAAAAALSLIGATSGGGELVAVAGVVMAGIVIAVAVHGRFALRQNAVQAAGLVKATEGDAEAGATVDGSAALPGRPEDLSALVAAFMASNDKTPDLPDAIDGIPVVDEEDV